MQPRHQVSRAGVELIKGFEGLRLSAAQLADGRWTIGYSHTRTARAGVTINAADAEALLLFDLIAVTHSVNEQVYAPLTQNQFDALTSFAFNIGVDNFRRSAALRRLNEGNYLQAAAAMELWRKADFEGERIVVDALVRRRAAEKMLFLTPADGWSPVSTAVLPPTLDYDPGYAPVGQAHALRTNLSEATAFTEREPEAPSPTAPESASPTETAAAAVSERLGALLPDEAPAVAEAEEPLPTPEPLTITPIEDEVAVAEARVEAAETAPEVTSEPPGPDAARERLLTGANLRMLGILGLAGLGIGAVVGSLLFLFRNANQPDGLFSLQSVGVVAVLVAVMLIAVGLYLFLARLGGDDDGDRAS